jgi:23S rRNA (cytidine1920-2'-O)/16S rRNA (cytidine1409-2'-O)-methyltransferase
VKKRIDILLVEKGLVVSRQRAQALIMAGAVIVNDLRIDKPGDRVEEDAVIRLRGEDHPYVSRAALKMVAALDSFKVDPSGRVALDVGASTGGFTQVMLLRGAVQVFALDVGHNQLDWKIRSDSRVVVMEGVNARYLTAETIGSKVDLITVDVSFISLEKILPALLSVTHEETDIITLVKPQFEVGRDKVGNGGIVNSEEDRLAAVERVRQVGEALGLKRLGLIESPIAGTDGNKEFLAHWRLC